MSVFEGFDTLQSLDEFTIQTMRDPSAELLEAIREKNYPKAYARLRKLDKALPTQRAGECLSAALHCSPELFRAVLEHCEPGEYAAAEQWRLDTMFDRYVNVTGTILTLAAAMDKVKHMRVLLDHGWDVNSASPASAQALSTGLNGQFFGIYWASDGFGGISQSALILGTGESNFYQKAIAKPQWSIDCCTPLAAAIVCGSVPAVRLLLRQPDVRREGSSAVCAAALVALHGGAAQLECLRMAFQLRSAVLNTSSLKRELLSERALDLTATAEFCTLREFTQRLSGIPCTVEQMRAAAEALANRNYKKKEEKLLRLLAHCPELGEEQTIRDHVLRLYLRRSGGQRVGAELLRCWKELCGEVRDISALAFNCTVWDGDIAAGFRAELSKLGEGGVLCAAAESAWLCEWSDKKQLAALSERVHFYRASQMGISYLAMQILKHKDAKFIKLMTERGMLDNEPREELLAYAARENSNPMLRAMLLAAPVNRGGAEAHEAMPEGGVFWSGRLERMGRKKRRAWAREAWERPLGAEACLERLGYIKSMSIYKEDLFCVSYSLFGGSMWGEAIDGMGFNSVAAAACCGRNPELLRVLLDRKDPVCERKTWVTLVWSAQGGSFGARESLNGSMLCAAAAAGRTEQVRLLLDRGFDPNEADMAWRSTYSNGGTFSESLVVTPLYMALEKGHYETARLLRERGGMAWPVREEDEARCG